MVVCVLNSRVMTRIPSGHSSLSRLSLSQQRDNMLLHKKCHRLLQSTHYLQLTLYLETTNLNLANRFLLTSSVKNSEIFRVILQKLEPTQRSKELPPWILSSALTGPKVYYYSSVMNCYSASPD